MQCVIWFLSFPLNYLISLTRSHRHDSNKWPYKRISFLARLSCRKTSEWSCNHKNTQFRFSTSFLAEKKRTQSSTLPPGRHAFQFSFKIPPYNLPSSFESKHGYVRYWMKARIHRAWRFDEVSKELVNILSSIDVNCPRMLVSGIKISASKYH